MWSVKRRGVVMKYGTEVNIFLRGKKKNPAKNIEKEL